MPLNFCLLGSGSKGNSVYISDGDSAVLVDCGFSARQCILRMEKRGLDPGRIQAIVITHEHRDHCSGARVLAKRLKAPVWATKGTWRAIGDLDGAECNTIIPGNRGLRAGRLELRPFTIPHDANDPVGFVIQGQNGKLGIATDLGQSTRLVEARLMDCDALIIEANHDPSMLDQGPYPPWLKQRVKGSQGHLANEDGSRSSSPSCTMSAQSRWCWPIFRRPTTSPAWPEKPPPLPWMNWARSAALRWRASMSPAGCSGYSLFIQHICLALHSPDSTIKIFNRFLGHLCIFGEVYT
jgi:phosphoribosyl 1,2-cyclic phosphodiesterase